MHLEYVVELKFSNGVVDEWYRLSNHIVSGETAESFKRRLDNLMDEDERLNEAEVVTEGLPQ